MRRIIAIGALLVGTATLAACELAPKTSYQNGHRGTGMNTIKVSAEAAADAVPGPPYDPPGTDGQRAGEVYENLQVLGDVSVDQFNYTMAALTEWVSPVEGCNYCHDPANMASDAVYTKIVARRMLEMTRNLNQGWTNHVGDTGVTCWTCHRGEPVPSESWTLPVAGRSGIVNNRAGQNEPVSNSAYSSLPTQSVALYLMGRIDADENIRVVSETVHPTSANRLSTMGAEHSYALMMHLSQSLGVNCTYCHNTQSFQTWATSSPPRQTAWYGVRMTRDINSEYITPLASVFPAHRKGELGDPYKVNCATCHRGQNKPMGGYPMAKEYPALWSTAIAPPAPAPAPAAATATSTAP